MRRDPSGDFDAEHESETLPLVFLDYGEPETEGKNSETEEPPNHYDTGKEKTSVDLSQGIGVLYFLNRRF